jgi:cellulose biosynthesis protein BcsQ
LCAAAGLDPAGYVTFHSGDPIEEAEPVFAFAKPPAEERSVAPPRAAAIAFPRAAPSLHPSYSQPVLPPPPHAPMLFQQTPGAGAPPPVVYAQPEPSYSLPGPPQPRREPLRARPRPGAIPVPRHTGFAFCAAAGGCGVTTIAATVARLLANRGENIVVGDGSSLPMLPAHFGATHLSRGAWSLLPGRRRSSGAIHILSNADPHDGAGFARGWLARELQTFPHPWNRMLLDVSSSAVTDLTGLEDSGIVTVLVAHPDPASRVRLPLVFDEYVALGVQPYVLLNRFDTNNAAHIQWRREMSATLSEALLPFTIRASDLVLEAIVEGLTVDEQAPDSEVTADFRTLVDWLQSTGTGDRQ